MDNSAKMIESLINELLICKVCHDRATGYHFDVVSCESCKAFFRRNASRESELRCLNGDNRCMITPVTRRFCACCRLRKCFQVGMRKENIQSEEQRALRRARSLLRQKQQFAQGGMLPSPAFPNINSLQISGLHGYSPAVNYPGPELFSPSTSAAAGGPSQNFRSPRPPSLQQFPSTSASSSSSQDDHPLHNPRAFLEHQRQHYPSLQMLSGSHENRRSISTPSLSQTPHSLSEALAQESISSASSSSSSSSHPEPPCVPTSKFPHTNAQYPHSSTALSTLSRGPGPSSSMGKSSKSSSWRVMIYQSDSSALTSNADGSQEAVSSVFEGPNSSLISNQTSSTTQIYSTSNPFFSGASPSSSPSPSSSSVASSFSYTPQLSESYLMKTMSETNFRGMTAEENQRIEELLAAHRVIELSLSNTYQLDPMPFGLFRFMDVFIQAIIKMAKKIPAFRCLCTEDQITLLKAGFIEIILLRSVVSLNLEKGTWDHLEDLRQSAGKMGQDAQFPVKIDVLKGICESVYQAHKGFVASFRVEWRKDLKLMTLLMVIVLFTVDGRENLKNRQVVEEKRQELLNLLRSYLGSIYGSKDCHTSVSFFTKESNECTKVGPSSSFTHGSLQSGHVSSHKTQPSIMAAPSRLTQVSSLDRPSSPKSPAASARSSASASQSSKQGERTESSNLASEKMEHSPTHSSSGMPDDHELIEFGKSIAACDSMSAHESSESSTMMSSWNKDSSENSISSSSGTLTMGSGNQQEAIEGGESCQSEGAQGQSADSESNKDEMETSSGSNVDQSISVSSPSPEGPFTAKQVFDILMERLAALRILHEEHVKIFMDADPSQIGPLMIELLELPKASYAAGSENSLGE